MVLLTSSNFHRSILTFICCFTLPTDSHAYCDITDATSGRATYVISGSTLEPIINLQINSQPSFNVRWSINNPPTLWNPTDVVKSWEKGPTVTGFAGTSPVIHVDDKIEIQFSPRPNARSGYNERYTDDTTKGWAADWDARCASWVPTLASQFWPTNLKIISVDPTPGNIVIPRTLFSYQKLNTGPVGSTRSPLRVWTVYVEGALTNHAECTFNVPNLNLEHGTLSSSTADAHEQTTNGSISCTANANVHLRFADTNPGASTTTVPLGDHVTADVDLKINGISTANAEITLQSGVTPFTLRSKIHYQGGTGIFRASTVLLLDVM